MKKSGLLMMLLLTMVACGGGSAANVNGFWIGQAWNSDQTLAFTFTATLSQGNGTAVSVTKFNFGAPMMCFPPAPTESATFTRSGSANGVQTGAFNMTVSTLSMTAVNNTLTLTGTRGPDGKITGTWNSTGQSGCSGSGTFEMNIPPPV